ICFFFSSRRRHTRSDRDWSSDVCSSDLAFDIRTRGLACVVGNDPTLSIEVVGLREAGEAVAPEDRSATVADGHVVDAVLLQEVRSEERRVGKECRAGWSRDGLKKRRRRN